jgi:hypothetical protein
MVVAFSAPGFAVTITFDDVPSGTNIKTQYSGLGVTFSCINGTDASFNLCSSSKDVFARADLVGSASPPNVIGLDNATLSGFLVDERSGYFRADFATPQSFVSIDAIAVPPPERLGASQGGPFLQAFGTGGAFRGQDLYSNHNPITNCDDLSAATPCPYETLSVSRLTADITFVAFSSFFTTGGGHPMYGEFDNLTFGPRVVPEPGSLVLIASGLAAVLATSGIARRRSRKVLR